MQLAFKRAIWSFVGPALGILIVLLVLFGILPALLVK